MKSRRQLNEVAQRYADALAKKHPGLKVEPVFEAVEGHDLWIRVKVPAHARSSAMRVLQTTTELNERFWEETGLSITATVIDKAATVST